MFVMTFLAVILKKKFTNKDVVTLQTIQSTAMLWSVAMLKVSAFCRLTAFFQPPSASSDPPESVKKAQKLLGGPLSGADRPYSLEQTQVVTADYWSREEHEETAGSFHLVHLEWSPRCHSSTH